MASLQNFNSENQIPAELLTARIVEIHASISKLESLKPSKQVNSLFTQLVKLCTLNSSIDVKALSPELQKMRQSLILLSGRTEGLLELEFASFITKLTQPLNNLSLFPYYGNYVKLANLEYSILSQNGVVKPKKVAFVGSGPMPLTSLIMASHHMKSTHFDNFDIDEAANYVARKIVSSNAEFEKRMKFHTSDIMEVKEKLVSKEETVKILGHIRKYMKDGGVLLVRSANGARAFLYPVVEENELMEFEVLSIFHATNDVINSVVLVRKPIF
ncbi:hypothetical protein Pint_14162 [Pistacia integerrima]|uniref:Uncharacterized protein n=1 Tax=Pistacia integerrima TaxID=434235 RepID=A0ACC0Y7J5_9ROSI|nr:hypothetical protein Pint_14162 [Pistacia integerrima]